MYKMANVNLFGGERVVIHLHLPPRAQRSDKGRFANVWGTSHTTMHGETGQPLEAASGVSRLAQPHK